MKKGVKQSEYKKDQQEKKVIYAAVVSTMEGLRNKKRAKLISKVAEQLGHKYNLEIIKTRVNEYLNEQKYEAW